MTSADVVWLVAVLGLVVYELFALLTKRTTLSRAIWTADRGQYGPLLPFAVGILCGHFFWSGH